MMSVLLAEHRREQKVLKLYSNQSLVKPIQSFKFARNYKKQTKKVQISPGWVAQLVGCRVLGLILSRGMCESTSGCVDGWSS